MIPILESRQAGILLHPTSLPGPFGVGSVGVSARGFVDWLAETGCSFWQILPLVPNGRENSPYFSWSAFAGNPLLVDLENLLEHGFLSSAEIETDGFCEWEVDFPKVSQMKLELLLKAAQRLIDNQSHSLYPKFLEFREKNSWVDDASLFSILRHERLGKPWWEWEEALRAANPESIKQARVELKESIERFSAVLFFFDYQWAMIRSYCAQRGIWILGDLPIYVDHDSCDVWLNQSLFKLLPDGTPEVVSGAPPDAFAREGQLWGNPIYRWDLMAEQRFSWWRDRLRRCLELADVIRIDHFRALAGYWEIPAGVSDARRGYWVQGPGQYFFDCVREDWPELPLVAEDLGTLDDAVYRLRDHNGLMGMRIFQFGFEGDWHSPHLPHHYPDNCICYTGTHDNQTLAGWRKSLPMETQREVARYFQMQDAHCSNEAFVWSIVESAFGSSARLAVIPVQDFLVYDNWARMNWPDRHEGNWKWRLRSGELTQDIAERVSGLLCRYGRQRVG